MIPGALTATFHTGIGCLVGPSVLYLAVRALVDQHTERQTSGVTIVGSRILHPRTSAIGSERQRSSRSRRQTHEAVTGAGVVVTPCPCR